MTRYKLQISDGSNLAVAMLATQLNDRVMVSTLGLLCRSP